MSSFSNVFQQLRNVVDKSAQGVVHFNMTTLNFSPDVLNTL